MTARILVVDDIPANVKLLEARLLAEYFDVLTAGDGYQALAICERNQVDLVLLDIMMPGMDGFEVCERLKANPKTSHIPVVMVTALDQSADRVRGLKAGADDFLTKPVAHEELRRAIGRFFEPNGNACVGPPDVASRPSVFQAKNSQMREIQAVVAQVGWSEAPVLIQGETGSGKEVLARQLTARSPRAGKPFLKTLDGSMQETT